MRIGTQAAMPRETEEPPANVVGSMMNAISSHRLSPTWVMSLLGVLALAGVACSDDSSMTPTCGAGGGTQGCVCPDGQSGAQTCGLDGAWSDCACSSSNDLVEDVTADTVEPDAAGADTSGPDTSGPDTAGPDTSGPDTPEVDTTPADTTPASCGNAVCEPDLGEDAAVCSADCLATCETAGTPCTVGVTNDANDLLCVAFDSTDPTQMACQPSCELHNECTVGFFCGFFGDGRRACTPSNCTNIFASGTECATAGEHGGTCHPVSNSANYCVAAGTGEPGTLCQNVEDCQAGLSCRGSLCVEPCGLNGAAPQCAGQGECLPELASSTIGVCRDVCSGLGAAAWECPTSQHCVNSAVETMADGDGVCIGAGTNGVGEACDHSSECTAGTLCTPDSVGSSTCLAVCEPEAANTCPGDQICAPAGPNGVCLDSCTPLAPAPGNGCTDPGVSTCWPRFGPDIGSCEPSGSIAAGSACTPPDGTSSSFGVCEPGLFCDVPSGAQSGVCRSICLAFSSISDYASGCEAGEVCQLRSLHAGVCAPATILPPPAPLEPCSDYGEFCSDDVVCMQLGTSYGLCLPFCRLGSDDDCPGQARCLSVLASSVLGLCLP